MAALVERTGVAPEEADLIVDLGAIQAVRDVVSLGRHAWHTIGSAAPWRNVVLLAGSFPWNVEYLKDCDVTPLLRVEWAAWEQLQTEGNHGDAPPLVYGDYSTSSPQACDSPAELDAPPTLYEKPRYTTGEYFLIGKGRRNGSRTESRLQALAERIVTDPEFRPNHTEGERWLQGRAADPANQSPGTPETWVTMGHIQHLAFITEQLGRRSGRLPSA